MEMNKGRTRVISKKSGENPLPKECAIYGTLRISTNGQAHVWGGSNGWWDLNLWKVKGNANGVRRFKVLVLLAKQYHNQFPCKFDEDDSKIMPTRQQIRHEWTAKPG